MSAAINKCWNIDHQGNHLHNGTVTEEEKRRTKKLQDSGETRFPSIDETSNKLLESHNSRRLGRLRTLVDETARYAESNTADRRLPGLDARSRVKVRKRWSSQLKQGTPVSTQDRRWLTVKGSMLEGKRGPVRSSRRANSLPLGENALVVNLRRTKSSSDEPINGSQETRELSTLYSEDSISGTICSTRAMQDSVCRAQEPNTREPPLEKFRRVVRLLSFLQKMKSSTDSKQRGQQQQQQTATVLEQLQDEAQAGPKTDEEMVFDPNNFKAVKEVQLSQEAVHILSLSPYTRSDEDLQTALTALKASVSAFGEYPLKMQKRLVSVGWYERFEAKRVIIRQGHRAENFYFILSGTAIVTLLVSDNSGEQRNNTIAVLTKGSSFGELALLHHKTRSATVLCKDEVSLLAVGREDFRDIFMSYEDGKEPEHIRFLKTVPYLKDLPLDDLVTKHDLCIFHYFRRGVVIVKGGKTDWVYIVKTGSCRVLTHLVKKKALKRSSVRTPREQCSLPTISVHETGGRRKLFTVAGHRERPIAVSPLLKRPKTEPGTSKKEKADLSLPAIIGEPHKFKKTVRNVAIPWLAHFSTTEAKKSEAEEHRRKIEVLHKKVSGMDAAKSPTKQNDPMEHSPEDDPRNERVVVQIELLKPKDQFGMSSVVLDKPGVQCHLVSNGAECVLIKKSWLLQYATESTMRVLRSQIPPYPSQETLEQKMQDQANWDSYKTQTINHLLDTLRL